MAFIERQFDVGKDFPEYRTILGESGKRSLDTPQGWVIDVARGVNFIELGGRGEMPASTGAPPDAYYLVMDNLVYPIALRSARSRGKNGGLVYGFSVESIDFPVGNMLSQENFMLLLSEALYACEESRLRRIKSQSFVEGIVISG